MCLAQESVAKKLKTTIVAVCRYEQGTLYPSVKNMCKLAEIFGVSVEFLVGGKRRKKEEEWEEVVNAFASLIPRERRAVMSLIKKLGER